MPMGPYKDFDDCVAVHRKKGHDMDSAKKMCGAIKARIEGNGNEKKELAYFITKDTQVTLTESKKSLVGILSSANMDRGMERMDKGLIRKWAMEAKPIPLLSLHKNDWREQVGVIVARRSLGSDDALFVEAKLLDSTPTAKAFQEYLKELNSLGMGVGLSIGAIPIEKETVTDEDTFTTYTLHKDAELVEGSVVPIGANREAYGYLAKKFNLEINEEVQKMAETMGKQMPATQTTATSAEQTSDYSAEIKKIMAEIEALKKENQSMKEVNEKAIEEIVNKALVALHAEKKSMATETEKKSDVQGERFAELAAVKR